MQGVMGSDFQSTVNRLGRHWVWVFVFGVLSIAVGVLALIWPGATLLVIALLFAAQLVVGSFYQFVAAFAIPGESAWLRALTALLAVISFVVGIFLLGHAYLSLLVLALVLGFYWMVHGIIHLFVAAGRGAFVGRGWMIVHGVLSIIVGAITILVPGISLLALTIVLGAWLVVYGAILAMSAFQLRSLTHRLFR